MENKEGLYTLQQMEDVWNAAVDYYNRIRYNSIRTSDTLCWTDYIATVKPVASTIDPVELLNWIVDGDEKFDNLVSFWRDGIIRSEVLINTYIGWKSQQKV